MPGYNSQRRGTAHTSQIFCFFLLLRVFCVLFVCKCVLYYCHRVSTQLQLNVYIYTISLYVLLQLFSQPIRTSFSPLTEPHCFTALFTAPCPESRDCRAQLLILCLYCSFLYYPVSRSWSVNVALSVFLIHMLRALYLIFH
jgi:hypothetical protein